MKRAFAECTRGLTGSLAILALLVTFSQATRADAQAFKHPGALYRQADIDAGRANASNGLEPWKAGFDQLVALVETDQRFRDQPILAPQVYMSDWVAEEEVCDAAGDNCHTVKHSHVPPNAGNASLLEDGHVAFTCALYWRLFRQDPARNQQAAACKTRAVNTLRAWINVQYGYFIDPTKYYDPETAVRDATNATDMHFGFYVSGLFLAADMLGSDILSGELAEFRDWVDHVAAPRLWAEYQSNINAPYWPPIGQNHGGYALYSLLLARYVIDDVPGFQDAARTITEFIWRSIDAGLGEPYAPGTTTPTGELTYWSYNDATLGNERVRGVSGLMYSGIALLVMTSSLRVIRNAELDFSGAPSVSADLFDALPDQYDTKGEVGTRVRRALQAFYYYQKHPDLWPYWPGADPCWIAGSLFDAMAAVYGVSEYAGYAKEGRPHPLGDNGELHKFMFTDPRASLLLSDKARSIDVRSPGTNTFERDAAEFSVRNGTWQVVAEPGEPAGNRVYWQSDVNMSLATSTMGNVEWLDYTVAANLKVSSFGSSSNVGLFARYSDDRNFYAFIWNASDNKLYIQKRFNGYTTTVATSAPFYLQRNRWYTFLVDASGPVVSFTVADKLGGSSTTVQYDGSIQDSRRHAFLSGKVGVEAHRADVMSDNFCVARDGSFCIDMNKFLPTALIHAVIGS